MNVITINDPRYPKLLKEIGKDIPKQLYYKGKWDEGVFENCLAVVGSRKLTSYGRRVTEQLITEISAAGITIVSGFMYGGDEAAHRSAVKAGRRTIAVMPCGIELIHPEEQQDLYVEILDNKGLVISEYEGDMAPALWTYPRRNRIVAGLSKAVLVVEAGEKSGSLITANFAKRFKRKVFAVPGPITSEVSKGTLQLLREGATMVTSARDILDYFMLREPDFSNRDPFPASRDCAQTLRFSKSVLSTLEKQIVEQLQGESLTADELARDLNISAAKLGTTLSLMQLKGLISQEGGKYYVN